jgi:hypothetical protein
VSRRAILTAAVLLGACNGGGGGAPRTSDRAQRLDGPPPVLTPRWRYAVTKNGSGLSGSFTVASNSDKHEFLDSVEARVEEICPSDPSACEVDIDLYVCDEANPPCSSAAVAEVAGWTYVFDEWHEAQADQIAFLESQNVPAHWVQGALEEHREYQQYLLEEAQDAVGEVHDARDALVAEAHDRIAAMGAQATSEEQVRLANTRWAIRELDRVTRRYQAALDRVRPLYADVAARFAAYRGGEPAAIQGLEGLIAQASEADLGQMAPLKVTLAAISNDENRMPQQLILDANRVRWELAYAQAEYERGLAPHAAVIDEQGWTRLDHTTAAREGMGGVVAYAEQRQDRVNTAVRDILDGIHRREAALTVAAADTATRDQIRAAAAAHTEAAFLDEITARTTELWKSPPTTPTLKLPLLADRVRTMQAFLQLEALCADPTQATWRAPGCLRVTNELTKVKKYLGQTLPFTIRFNVKKLRTAGAVESELTAIEADLTAGRVLGAVHRYDAALRAVEEG